ncbi:non-ribosomal peptide synthetase [Pontibacter pamirensis]|uniref:non-ribosomal peptide synthetase n=1 Tax=Pontibacter pamirensis TaxID=2562824 RepID=UPI001389BA91|nr:non-ribosomal peptide synthetase [Pontibacter pamirensis]
METLNFLKKASPLSALVQLHPAQQEIYFDQVTDCDSPHYNVGGYMVLKGQLNKETFKEVCSSLPLVFDVLRMHITSTDEAPFCTFLQEEFTLEVEEQDFSDETDPKKKALDWMQERFNNTFDLESTLYELSFFKISEEEHWLYGRFHHLITDGFGFAVLAHYVARKYTHLLKASSELFAFRYSSYEKEVEKALAYLDSESYQKDAAYWKEQFLQVPEPLLKIRNEGVNQSGTVVIEISEAHRILFEATALQTNSSLQQLTLAALTIYFARTENRDDVVFGIPVHNRRNKLQRSTVGLFAGMIPFKGHYYQGKSVSSLLQTIKLQQRTDYRYQSYPISHLNRELKLMAQGRNQLFDVVVNYALLDFEVEMEGVEANLFDLSSQYESQPIQFWWRDYGKNQPLQLRIDYHLSYFTKEEAELLGQRLLFILEQLPTALDERVGEIEIVPEKERRQLLEEFNATAASYPKDKTLVDLFEEQAARTPDNLALVFEKQQLTYQQLDQKANQLARYLRAKGVREETLVPICINRSMEMLVGLFGIMKAGGAYVPIDPSYPSERVAWILEDTGATISLCGREQSQLLRVKEDMELVLLDEEWAGVAEESVNKLETNLQPSNLAYIIYTSGSTGKPKGVLVEHKGVVNLTHHQRIYHAIQPDEKILQVSNYTFDASVEQIFLALSNGAALVLIPDEVLLDTQKLEELIRTEKITSLDGTPSLLQHITTADYSSLKRVIAGGEACPVGLAREWAAYFPFYNEYGPTETTITSVEYLYSIDNLIGKTLPIGKPVSNTTAYVVDKAGKLVPKGTIGELCIGGVQVTRGYLNRPELTAKKFVSDPFSADADARMYRTGDLVRWLPDGNLEFLGRSDDQVKIHGYRIELGEVESVLGQCKGVRQSVVIAKKEPDGNKRLIGYVVAEGTFDKEAIREEMKRKLPEYMVPSFLVELEEMPLMANGKTNKKALPEVEVTENLTSSYVAPRTEIEEKLVAIWQDLLQVERVGVEDNFFELGGHSLLATRVVSFVRKTLQSELQIKDVFSYPTIAGLAEQVERNKSSKLLPAITAVPHDVHDKFPLSFSQERLWFIDQLQGSTQYHLPAAFRLRGDLDIKKLSQSLRQVVQRHEVLRTVIRQDLGKAYQQVQEEDWHLSYMDEVCFADAAEMHAFIQETVLHPFDLSRDFMLRAVLVRFSEQDHLLVVVVHHIAADGWSVPILVNELTRLYEAGGDLEVAAMEPLPVQYADFATWQRRYLQGEVLEEQLHYWKKQLTGVEALELPADFARPAVQSSKGGRVSLQLNGKISEALESFSQQEGVTPFMSLLSVMKVLLYRYSGQEDICVGSPIAGRRQAEVEPLIGFFVNTLALRTQISPDVSFLSLLQEVKTTTLEAYAHQEVPFEKVVEAVGVARDLSRTPLFQVMFTMENTSAVPALKLGDVSLTEEVLDSVTAKFDLSLTVNMTAEDIEINVEYCKDIFKTSTVQRMLGHYQELLRQVLQHPEQSISQLELVTEEEAKQLTAGFNATAASYPANKTLVELFEEQAAKTPEAIAVAFGEAELTYGELNKRVNQLAHYLQKRGVKQESLVPVCINRSIELVTAQLAILKAGGAYVPIDPSYPQERIRFMLEDTDASLVLSSSAHVVLLKKQEKELVLLDTDWEKIAKEPSEAPAVSLQPSHLAYVIYTSGSTGKPKGVLVEHRGVVNLCAWHAREFNLNSDSKSTMMAGVGFDASAWEVWPVLLSGASSHIVQDEQRLEAEKLLSFFLNKGITHSFVPTALVDGLVKQEQPQGLALQYVLTGGDQLRSVDTTHLSYKLVNNYGPTENTVVATSYTLPAAHQEGLPPIGKPISNTTAYVLDKSGKLVPQGVAGELCIGGAQVARGYLNREELTAEKFVKNPFSKEADASMYRTGDLVRWLEDGNLEFLGRVDDQVKIRGYRIELGEVESVLQQCHGVQQAVVVAKADASGNKRLIGYAVAEEFDKEVIISEMKRKLPDYMVPSILVELEEIPLTANGKVNKKALPEVDASASLSSSYVAPRTETEEKLANIWQELLQVERVGVEDNFFELGGDSIITIQLVSRARKAGFTFQPRHVFEYQTVASLAAVAQTEAQVKAEQGELRGEAGLLPIQQWFFEQELEAPHHFNQSLLLKVDKALSSEELSQAFTALVAQHDSLRFTYHQKKKNWRQEYGKLNSEHGNVEVVSLKDLSGDMLSTGITAVCEAYQQGIVLEKGEIMKLVLLETPIEEESNRLLLAIHHLAVDGVSWRILLEDLEQSIMAVRESRGVELGLKSSSYRQWQAAMQQYAETKAVGQQTYWQKTVKTAFTLPVDKDCEVLPKVADQESCYVTLSASLTQALLTEVQQAYHTQINDFLLAALADTLGRWSNQKQVVIALEGHGREDISAEVDISRTVGWFTNLYPVLLDIDNQASASGLLQSVKEQLRQVPGKGLGYGALRYLHPEKKVRESLAGQNFEVVFNYLGQLDNAIAGSQWFAGTEESAGAAVGLQNQISSKLDIGASVLQGQLSLEWRYAANQYEAETIKTLAENYLQLLTDLITHCQEKQVPQHTPSDYGLGGKVAYQELETFLRKEQGGKQLQEQISSLYALSPLQEGLLFHSLYDQTSLSYIEQMSCRFEQLDVEKFSATWKHLLQKHSILRSSFHQELSVPVQCVHQEVALPLQVLDLRNLSEEEQKEQLDAFKDKDRNSNFDFSQAPLLRLTLLRIGEAAYEMVWTYHHLLLDGWSMPVLMHEMLSTYENLLQGEIPETGAEDKYEDFIRYIQKQDEQEAAQFWKQYLEGVEEPSLLPFVTNNGNRNKGADQLYQKVEWVVAESLHQAMQAYGQKHRLTLNTLIQGVWAYLLAKYSGQPDALYGVTVAGRPTELAGAEQRVGLYINTLPLRSRIEEGKAVQAWLEELQQAHMEAREFSYTPLSDIQNWQGLKGDLFDSLLVFENYPVGEVLSRQWQLQVSEVEIEEQTNYPLSISCQAIENLSLNFSYNASLLSKESVEQIKTHFAHVLQQIVSQPDLTLSQLVLVTEEEKRKLAVDFNATAASYPADKTLVELFEEQAAKTPEAIAAAFGEAALTYGELNKRANQLAHYLQRKGVDQETLVPVCMDRSIELVTAQLAILKAGGAYVPIDPSYPQERIRFMLEDTDASLVLSSSAHAVLFEKEERELVLLDTDWEKIAKESPDSAAVDLQPSNLAYVIYTSGSTGKPKGVLVEHRGVVNLCSWHASEFSLNSDSKSTMMAGVGFDASAWEVWPVLVSGASLYIVQDEQRLEAEKLLSFFLDKGITHSFVPTALVDGLVKQEQPEGLALQYVLTGGDQLRTVDTSHLTYKLVNNYGPTENTVVASSYTLPAAQLEGLPPIGRPISNTTAYVLDKAGKLVPQGVAGELCIGGAQVARGYLNRADLTQEKFVQDPFSQNEGVRLYKTGDLVRWLADGNLEYLGRIDDQVKVRGYRIELGEVESVLQQCVGVQQAVVIAKADASGNKRLIGYAVAEEFDKEAILNEMKRKLPEYMVPSIIVELQEVPLTANGKVNKKALPEVDASEVLTNIFVAPRNETEEKLANIWQDLLQVERVGVEDNFFELGGHSLLATRFVSSVRREFNSELQIKDVFSNPTIAGLAEQIGVNKSSSLLPPITAVPRDADDKLPLSFSQERLWFIDQLQGSSHYHMPAVFRLTGQVDVPGLEASFRRIVERHEALRTVFRQDDGQAYQQVIEADWQLIQKDGHALVDAAAVHAMIQSIVAQPFDLREDYMLRAVLVKLSEQEHLLVVVLHHIASDGWSISILVRELTKLYQAKTEGQEASLPPLQIQYADYALWQREYLQGEVLEEQTDYWKNKLSGVEALQLPTDYARPSVQSTRGARLEFSLDKDLSQQLEQFSNQQGVTLFMSLLSAFKVLLYRYSGQEDVCVGSPIAGRMQPEVEPLIGFFVNTLALRSDLAGNPGFLELLERVKDTTLAAYDHQDLPFEKVVEAAGVERDMSRSPLFQVMFILQNTPEVPEVRLGDLTLAAQPFEGVSAKFDMTLSVAKMPEGLEMSVEYCADLFSEATVSRMMSHYERLLSLLVSEPTTGIDQLQLLGQQERKLLLEGFNTTAESYPKESTLVDLFEEQVLKTPDATAVVFEEEQLTYRELNERANQLAHYLQKKGVREDSLVPICVDRSIEMMVGLLGILKAGGAYVPLDPSYPQDRIQYMLEDTQATLVLGNSAYADLLTEEEGRELVLLDRDLGKIAQEPTNNLKVKLESSNLVYIIYTSGSTGRPKGVLIQHQSLVNFLYSMIDHLEVKPKASLLAVTTYSFDISYLELYMPMLVGGKVIIASREVATDGYLLQEKLTQHQPSYMQATPATWQMLLDSGWQNSENITVLLGGEAVRKSLKDALTKLSKKVWNLYGPTETTIWSSCKELKAGEKITIGKPIANTQIYIIEKAGEPAPVGVAGELCIGGDGLARGYLNRPELTAERFVPDPFSASPNARMYRTGDLARWLANGDIEYLSRLDDQVKIRGYRIELGEIESVLQQCDGVSKGVVAARTDNNGNKRLVGYIVPQDAYKKEAVLTQLRSRLPDYMVPSLFVTLTELPLTPNGKVNRKALPEPDIAELLTHQYVAPSSETEEKLTKLWQNLLGLERVGVKDNFFELGGDSLLVVRVVSLIREEFSLNIPVNTLFKFSCIAELAEYIEAVSIDQDEEDEDGEELEVFEI